jgi:hypothetical protein
MYFRHYLPEVFAGHFWEHGVEVFLILVIDESVVEHSHRFVTEQTEHLLTVADYARIRLEQTYNTSNRQSLETYSYDSYDV